MRLFIKCLMLFVFSAFQMSSFAQSDSISYCSSCLCSEDQTPAGVMISHVHEKNQWMISYRYMSMHMGNMRVGNKEVSNNYVFQNYLMTSDKMRMDMHMLMLMYGVNNRLTLMAMFNYNYNRMNMQMVGGSHHHHHGSSSEEEDSDPYMTSNGIGDIEFHALYSLINTPKHHLLFSGGVSLPIGTTQLKGGNNSMYAGIHLPYNMQLGSGTYDICNTLNYLYIKSNISWSSQLSSVLRTGRNTVGYKFGNEYTLNNWGAWQWSKFFSSSVRLEAQTIGSINGADKTLYAGYEPAANPANYGGHKVNAYLGTNIYVFGQRIGIEAGVPVYQYLYGPQMKSTFTINASCNVVF